MQAGETKILIVEDELLIAKSLARRLQRLGYAIADVVGSGDAALCSVATNRPHLVLMDIVIKGARDGIETAEEILAKFDVPVVFVTAYADNETLERAENVGSYGYVLKPFEEAEIHAAIRMALSKHRQTAELRRWAVNDPLTGVFNRRHFFALAEHELNRAKRYGETFSILLLDIDHFKHINDTYGHVFGDDVIKQVARMTVGLLRTIDCFARFGGEEFIALLPKTDADSATSIAERIRAAVAEHAFTIHKESVPVTVSIGVAVQKSGEGAIDGILQRADEALYRAKGQGRNRVCVL